ncbi:hypothetical protein [Cytophaga aurantiaca]|uniref:hypothetical protein n=1 Tax=Cytophaga aurantiaca TaxID=29530 RepID=UPI00037CC2AD|nr:hypothetical protein [Cytophaga aurantiaca]
MKKTLITLFLSLTACMVFAQTTADSSMHLTFKGVPLDGTLDQYVSKMVQRGFKHISTESGIAMLQGDFAGYKGCYVGVSTLKQKDLVHKIVVLFPEKDTWSTLSGSYFDLKQMLTEKYGAPTVVVEKFDRDSPTKDDDSKMYDVKFDRCKYYAIWETGKGEIQLSIDHSGMSSCFVKLIYLDKINSEAVKKQAIDDL